MSRPQNPEIPDNLRARRAASSILRVVLDKRRPLDEALGEEIAGGDLRTASARDRGFTRLIVATVLRRLGEIDFVLAQFIETDLPSRAGPAIQILRGAVAEILFLDVKPHAAVSEAVELAGLDHQARHFKSLVNAVLRRVVAEGKTLLSRIDAERLNTPEWLWASWTQAYGEKTAREIIRAQFDTPPLDISLKNESESESWAEKLGATLLPTGSLRLTEAARVDTLPGFDEGAWWVQDMAAALPPKLFGPIAGEDVLDLCAAPGGKTASLLAQGAKVTALDRSAARLQRLRQNLERLSFHADIITKDASLYSPDRRWKYILLDAPCTATGTARRHPDVLRLKTHEDRNKLAELQALLLDHCATFLEPGGTLIYCTCSLEPEEGPDQIETFLHNQKDFARKKISVREVGHLSDLVTPAGDVRTLPSHMAELGGMDGFFIARLTRKG